MLDAQLDAQMPDAMTQRVETPSLGIERLVRRGSEATFTDQYNCKLRRLFPWSNAVNTKRPLTEFGCIWVVVEPLHDVELHSHDEEETFVVIAGEASLWIDGQSTTIRHGDVVYLPRFSEHQLRNLSPSTPFVMLDIYWDDGGHSDTSLT